MPQIVLGWSGRSEQRVAVLNGSRQCLFLSAKNTIREHFYFDMASPLNLHKPSMGSARVIIYAPNVAKAFHGSVG